MSLWVSLFQGFTLTLSPPCSQDDPSKMLCDHVSFLLRMFQQFPIASPAGSGAPQAPALAHLPSPFFPYWGPWNPQHIPSSWLIIALVVPLSQMPFYSLPFAWLARTCPSELSWNHLLQEPPLVLLQNTSEVSLLCIIKPCSLAVSADSQSHSGRDQALFIISLTPSHFFNPTLGI